LTPPAGERIPTDGRDLLAHLGSARVQRRMSSNE